MFQVLLLATAGGDTRRRFCFIAPQPNRCKPLSLGRPSARCAKLERPTHDHFPQPPPLPSVFGRGRWPSGRPGDHLVQGPGFVGRAELHRLGRLSGSGRKDPASIRGVNRRQGELQGSLLAGAKDVEAAAAFAKFVATSEASARWATAFKANPVAKGAPDLMDAEIAAYYNGTFDETALKSLWWWPEQSAEFVAKSSEYADKYKSA